LARVRALHGHDRQLATPAGATSPRRG
jgi:hypothetical protein